MENIGQIYHKHEMSVKILKSGVTKALEQDSKKKIQINIKNVI